MPSPTLRLRILALVLVQLGLVVLAGIAGYLAVEERDASVALLEERLEPARDALNQVVSTVVDRDRAVRGYLLTGDPSLLPDEPADRLHASLERLVDELAFDPDLHEPAQRVRDAATTWQQEMALARQSVEVNEPARDETRLVAVLTGQAAFAAFRDQADGLREALVEAQSAARARVAEAREQLAMVLWVVIASAGAVAGTAWLLLRRWITVPLRRLVGGVEEVAEGNRHRVIPAKGPPEIAQLGARTEQMRSQIVGALDEALAAREALEQQGPAALLLREQLDASTAALPASLEVASALHPAEGILAGDWHEACTIADGCVAVAMVDVSGHGPAAGAFGLKVKHLLLAALRDGREPGDALGWVAGHLGDTGERFLSGFVAVIDPSDGSCRYANAGHPAPFVVEGQISALERTGPVLGPFPATWETARTTIGRGAMLVAYTDGIVEARLGDEQYGSERLRARLETRKGECAATVVADILAGVRAFTGGALDDDATVLVVRHRQAPRHGGR